MKPNISNPKPISTITYHHNMEPQNDGSKVLRGARPCCIAQNRTSYTDVDSGCRHEINDERRI